MYMYIIRVLLAEPWARVCSVAGVIQHENRHATRAPLKRHRVNDVPRISFLITFWGLFICVTLQFTDIEMLGL